MHTALSSEIRPVSNQECMHTIKYIIPALEKTHHNKYVYNVESFDCKLGILDLSKCEQSHKYFIGHSTSRFSMQKDVLCNPHSKYVCVWDTIKM